MTRRRSEPVRQAPPATPEEKLGIIVEAVRSQIARAQATVDGFAARFAEDPVRAFEWSQGAIEAATRLDVFESAVLRLTDNDGVPCLERDGKSTIESLRAYATDKIMHGARYPAHSSSQVSNVVSQQTVSAWAQLVEILRWF